MDGKKLFFYLCITFFLCADACLCKKPSVRHLYKAVKHRRYSKIIEILDGDLDLKTFNVLQCRMKHREKVWCIENTLFYQGLFTDDEIKAHEKVAALDLIEFTFRTHYQRNIDWYWKHDPEHHALHIILLCDNVRLFDFLNEYSLSKQFIDSSEGQEFCRKFVQRGGGIWKKYSFLRAAI